MEETHNTCILKEPNNYILNMIIMIHIIDVELDIVRMVLILEYILRHAYTFHLLTYDNYSDIHVVAMRIHDIIYHEHELPARSYLWFSRCKHEMTTKLHNTYVYIYVR